MGYRLTSPPEMVRQQKMKGWSLNLYFYGLFSSFRNFNLIFGCLFLKTGVSVMMIYDQFTFWCHLSWVFVCELAERQTTLDLLPPAEGKQRQVFVLTDRWSNCPQNFLCHGHRKSWTSGRRTNVTFLAKTLIYMECLNKKAWRKF